LLTTVPSPFKLFLSNTFVAPLLDFSEHVNRSSIASVVGSFHFPQPAAFLTAAFFLNPGTFLSPY